MLSDEECVRELAERFPELAVRQWRPVQQGWDSVTLLVNVEWIFRFARRPDVAVRLAREARLLPALAETLPVDVPRFEYVVAELEEAGGGVRLVGYRAVPGRGLDVASLRRDQMPALAHELGAALTALHSFPVERARELGVIGGDAGEWRDEYAAFYAEFQQHVFPLFAAEERERAAAMWKGFLGDAANFTFTPALIHRDLGPEHILYEPASGRLTGIIDWGDAWIGDPAIDFAGIWGGFGRVFAEQALAAYHRPVEATFWRRVAFYAAIGPYYEIRFGQNVGDASHIAHGLEALRKSLEER
jgi:aminoglycoside 2''-phosphotransferase